MATRAPDSSAEKARLAARELLPMIRMVLGWGVRKEKESRRDAPGCGVGKREGVEDEDVDMEG